MIGNNHENCGFGAAAAAYVYNELETRERANFEHHLTNCDSCAEQIGDFAAVRADIAGWKARDFDVLATPAFEIPYEQPAPAARRTRTEKTSLFDSLKNALTFSPAAAAFAAVALLTAFGVVGYFIFDAGGGDEYAGNRASDREIANSPAAAVTAAVTAEKEISPTPEVEQIAAASDAPETSENEREKTAAAPDTLKTEANKKRKSAAIAEDAPRTLKTPEPKRRADGAKTVTENPPVQAQTKLPKLNTLPDDEEIEELRLSDLLGDADSR